MWHLATDVRARRSLRADPACLPLTCIGIHLARLEVRVFLEKLLAAVPDWRPCDGVAIETIRLAGDIVPARFDALPLEVARPCRSPRPARVRNRSNAYRD